MTATVDAGPADSAFATTFTALTFLIQADLIVHLM